MNIAQARVSIFLFILGVGFVSQFFPGRLEFTVQEMRAKPNLTFKREELAKTIASVDSWFQENFVMRNNLIILHGMMKNFVFHTPSSAKVLFGRHGWLFFTDQNVLNDYRNNDPLPPPRVSSFTNALVERTAYSSSKAAAYLFVVGSNTHTIYSEELPAWLKKISTVSRADQIFDAAAIDMRIHFLDLKSPLTDGKSAGRLYHKTDTHMNALGGFVAYRAIMARLSDLLIDLGKIKVPLKTLELTDFERTELSLRGGDLAKLLASDFIWKEDVISLRRRGGWNYEASNVILDPYKSAIQEVESSGGFTALQPTDYVTKNNSAPNKLKVFIFRDSYFSALQPYFSESFSQVTFAWDAFNSERLQNESFDILIDETVERSLQGYAIKK